MANRCRTTTVVRERGALMKQLVRVKGGLVTGQQRHGRGEKKDQVQCQARQSVNGWTDALQSPEHWQAAECTGHCLADRVSARDNISLS
ncbi:hypothetical protein J6590_081967 [Homalodisca vitripennis]|nr:hypothetical protein J6590_081967 [Homalodisca vitripennis]